MLSAPLAKTRLLDINKNKSEMNRYTSVRAELSGASLLRLLIASVVFAFCSTTPLSFDAMTVSEFEVETEVGLEDAEECLTPIRERRIRRRFIYSKCSRAVSHSFSQVGRVSVGRCLPNELRTPLKC